jgi:NADH-quinone oxidoreductase subunit F
MNRIGTATELKEKKESILAGRDPSQPWISVCGGTGCLALGAEKVGDAFREEMEKQGLKAKVNMALTGCPGFCERGPLVVIYPEAIFYKGRS